MKYNKSSTINRLRTFEITMKLDGRTKFIALILNYIALLKYTI